MSILALSSTKPAADEMLTRANVLIQLALLIMAITVAAAMGVFRRRSILGPVRLPGSERPWPMIIVTGIGGASWLLAQTIYIVAVSAALQPGQPFDESKLSGGDLSFLATVPAVVAFAILILGDLASRQRLLDKIGFTASRLRRGVLAGLLAILVVWPIVNCGAGFLLEMFYRLIHFEHPHEHEVLAAMKSASPWVKFTLIFGACVAAPVFEEFLFRGHLQTLLVRLFNDRVRPRKPAAGALAIAVAAPAMASVSSELASGDLVAAALPVPPLPAPGLQPLPAPGLEPLEYATAEMPASAPRPQRLVWLAVVITSMIFASVHPLWMAPLIFVLSLCLGYAYERTGNLWVSITIHALFNASSTLLFLK